jgi:hypothetical protein
MDKTKLTREDRTYLTDTERSLSKALPLMKDAFASLAQVQCMDDWEHVRDYIFNHTTSQLAQIRAILLTDATRSIGNTFSDFQHSK